MSKKTVLLILSITFLAILTGCSTGGSFLANNVTNVELSEPNFDIVAKNIEGYSPGFYRRK